ncbi:hypothetical protein SAMN02745729_13125 [Marinobacterium iners DSM 11526]|uniref:Uncharacterized protein n=1 Tax=Marinobacterium iners DSM 11526 TaxID=1122198 RepID=A0A1H4H9X8_9GAMM|nr:hypothetical protein SAMN02745729_13125 [Marinobacterium iners DSM 11526]
MFLILSNKNTYDNSSHTRQEAFQTLKIRDSPQQIVKHIYKHLRYTERNQKQDLIRPPLQLLLCNCHNNKRSRTL